MYMERISESFSKQSFLSTIGAKLESVELGKVSVSCAARDDLKQHTGVLHAGVICAVADVACAYAAMTTVPDNCGVVSAEFKVNLLRPMAGAQIIAAGRVVKPGKSLVVTDADVVDSGTNKLIAKMMGTMVVIENEHRT